MVEISLGVNNCFAVKRWPEPQAWAEIVGAQLDLNSVQFTYDLLDPRTTEPGLTEYISETLDACERYGVKIHSAFSGLIAYSQNLLTHPSLGMRMDALDWYAKAIDLCTRLKARGTGGHVAAFSRRDFLTDERRRYLEEFAVESIKLLTERAAKQGHEFFMIEAMAMESEIMPCTISGTERLYEMVSKVSKVPSALCLDLGHACGAGTQAKDDLNPYSWISRLGSKTLVMHLQQTDGKQDHHWPFTEEYNRIGIIKPDKVIKAIEGSGAKQMAMFLEAIHAFEAPVPQVLEEVKQSIRYWKEYL